MIRTFLRFKNTAVYLMPQGHRPVQCMEVRRERRKGLVQRPFTLARGLRQNLPDPVDGREGETPSGARAPRSSEVRQVDDPEPRTGSFWLESGVPGLERPQRERKSLV